MSSMADMSLLRLKLVLRYMAPGSSQAEVCASGSPMSKEGSAVCCVPLGPQAISLGSAGDKPRCAEAGAPDRGRLKSQGGCCWATVNSGACHEELLPEPNCGKWLGCSAESWLRLPTGHTGSLSLPASTWLKGLELQHRKRAD